MEESESIVKLRVARRLLAFFQLNGMLLITHPRRVMLEKVLMGLGAFYMGFLILSISTAMYFLKLIFDMRNSLGLFMDVIQLAIPVSTHFFILTQSFTRREFHRKIWEMFDGVEMSLRGNGIVTAWNLRNFLVRYATKFILLVGTACGIEVFIIVIIFPSTNGWKWHRMLAFTPFLGNRLCLMMLMFYTELYREFLQIIVQELKKAADLAHDEGAIEKPLNQFVLYQKCKCLRRSFNMLWLINKYINKSFGLSIFFNITMNFIILIVDYYWNFKAFFLNSSANPLASILCSFPLIVCLIPFIQSCHSSFRPIPQIKHLISGLHLRGTPKHFGRFFKQFSLQMLQLNSHLDASGFFTINYELLHSLAGAMSIYLVIFIQFELADHYVYNVAM
uniref:Gustatory receptor n=1 Tax=Lutzomyia longipalpis TaxID=7200 RepID=A0A240SXN5_LUTLO